MDATLRAKFNAAFTEKAYETYLKQIDALAPETLGFRVAETPIFVPKDFTKKNVRCRGGHYRRNNGTQF